MIIQRLFLCTYDKAEGVPQGSLSVDQSVAIHRLRCSIYEPATYPRSWNTKLSIETNVFRPCVY